MSAVIVHTITKLELGGAQQNTLYTMEHLPPEFKGYLICGKGGILDKRALASEKYITIFCPFMVRQINPVLDFLTFVWMCFQFISLKPDIVHSHSSKAGILTRWAAFFTGTKHIIHTFHGFGFTPLQSVPVRKIFIFAERITARITQRLIAVAHDNVSKALSLKIGNEDKFSVVRSGVDFGYIEKKKKIVNIRRELGLDEKALIVGNVSCFKPQKGLFDFIECCYALEKNSDCYYVMVGDGDLRPKLEAHIKHLGLEKKVFMLGWREDAAQIIADFDILLHTAHFEGLPRVFLEAMYLSVPIVTTSIDGARDVIVHGVNGYLVEERDMDKIIQYTQKLLADKQLREEMGSKSRELLKEEFDIKIMSAKLNDLYLNLIKEEKND